jgi:hypothetical protein
MKNYPIQQTELLAVQQLCHRLALKYTAEPAIRPGVVWLSVFNLDGSPVTGELCFALGRALELQLELMHRDASAQQITNQLELIHDLA